jgi:hypothetical protein
MLNATPKKAAIILGKSVQFFFKKAKPAKTKEPPTRNRINRRHQCTGITSLAMVKVTP